MIADYFNISLKNMKHKRMRSFLTLVGILISITTIFVLISLSLGLEVTINEQFEKLGTDKFYVQPLGQFGPPGSTTAAQLTTADVEVLEDVSGVKDVTGWAIANAKIEFRDNIRFVMVGGMDPEKMNVAFGSYDITEGRQLDESGGMEVIVGYDYKHSDFLDTPIDVGDKILVNDVEFRVIGIFEKIGNSQDDRTIYMPEEEFRALFDIPVRVDAIVVQVDDPEDIEAVADRAERRLARHRDLDNDNLDFSILTPEELLGAVGTVLDIVTIFLGGIAAISLFVGGINIANAMFTSVLERTREIGVMKAIGAQDRDILWIFVIEAGLLGAIGGILGVAAGAGIGKAIEYIATVQLGTPYLSVAFPAWLVLGCIGFAFVSGAVSGLWPAWRATKIRTVEALRYE